MSNENQDYTPLSTEVRGPENLISLETKKSYKDKMKAKEIFETEIVAGRTYFDFNGQKYYIKKSTRQHGNDVLTFREERKFYYLSQGLLTQSEAEKLIREQVETFPPVAYKVRITTQGSKTIRNTEFLTDEEENKLIECYKEKIYDIDSIKKRLGLSKNTELQITPCVSATDMIQNTVEMRATSDATEWSVMSRVCYATGQQKDLNVFNSYEEFLDYEDGVEMTNAVAKATTEAEKNIKKK